MRSFEQLYQSLHYLFMHVCSTFEAFKVIIQQLVLYFHKGWGFTKDALMMETETAEPERTFLLQYESSPKNTGSYISHNIVNIIF